MSASDQQTDGPEGAKLSTGEAIFMVASLLAVTVIGILVVPSFFKARNTSQQNACVGNLRIIDAGKEQGAMAFRLVDGDTIASSQVNEYIKGNTTPICPGGGTYCYGVIGSDPDCSITRPTSHNFPGS